MSYFKHFSSSLYEFANGEEAVIQNISQYVEIIDEIKTNAAFYQDYYIRSGDRSDNVSFTLYQNPRLHWTFYLMNNHLREQGWPLDHVEIVKKAKRDFPHITLTTEDLIPSSFGVGVTVEATQSSEGSPPLATGIILSKDLDLGQLVIETTNSKPFNPTDIITAQNTMDQLQLVSVEDQYLAAHHYIQDEELYTNKLDLSPDPYVEVTNLEYYIQENEKLRQIIVLKPNGVNRVVSLFKQAIKSQ